MVGRCALHAGLVENEPVAHALTAQEHVAHDVQVVRQRQVLVHDLDAEPCGLAGTVDSHALAFEADFTLVERVDPGDPLDQRGLAGAVVADEPHDLTAADLEVDVVQGLHRPEGLRNPGAGEQRFTSHRRHGLLLCARQPGRVPRRVPAA